MKQKISFLFLLVLIPMLLIGCNNFPNYEGDTTQRGDIVNSDHVGYKTQSGHIVMMSDYIPITDMDIDTETKDLSNINESEIDENLTLGEALELFGTPRISDTSTDYPLIYSWSINESEFLYIVFEVDDRKGFMEKLHTGDYILPNETVQYTESGLRILTENEMRTVEEWIKGHKAIRAYILENWKTKAILFDSKS